MLFDQIAANRRRSVLLVAASVLLFAAAGAFVGLFGFGNPVAGACVFTVFAAAQALFAIFGADRVVLRAAGAMPLPQTTAPVLHHIVEELCLAAGLPKPTVYLVDSVAPNAFVTGRNPQRASLAVTSGLLRKATRRELEAVVAHEMSHIRNHDMQVVTIAVVVAGTLTMLAEWAWRFAFFRPSRSSYTAGDRDEGALDLYLLPVVAVLGVAALLSTLLRYATSRRRETLADESAVELTRDPRGMLAALEMLDADTTVVPGVSTATANLWIESPIPRKGWRRLLDTHPPLSARIAHLRDIAGAVALDPADGVRGAAWDDRINAELAERYGPRRRPVGAAGTVASPPPDATPPTPGWYQDPMDTGRLRVWDGGWTAMTSPPGGASSVTPDRAGPPDGRTRHATKNS